MWQIYVWSDIFFDLTHFAYRIALQQEHIIIAHANLGYFFVKYLDVVLARQVRRRVVSDKLRSVGGWRDRWCLSRVDSSHDNGCSNGPRCTVSSHHPTKSKINMARQKLWTDVISFCSKCNLIAHNCQSLKMRVLMIIIIRCRSLTSLPASTWRAHLHNHDAPTNLVHALLNCDAIPCYGHGECAYTH